MKCMGSTGSKKCSTWRSKKIGESCDFDEDENDECEFKTLIKKEFKR
jgi:hypothetical protein